MQYIAYRIAFLIRSLGSLKFHYWVGRRFIDIWLLIKRKDGRIVHKNLKNIGFSEKYIRDNHMIKQTFYNFAYYWIDFLHSDDISEDDVDQCFVCDHLHHIDRPYILKKGVIPLTAHIGNWELGGVALGVWGYRVSVVALDHADQRVNDFFVRRRELKGVKTIPLGKAGKECLAELKKGHLLALVGDRVFDSAEKVQRVPFFGHHLNIPRGPFVLALKTGAWIVPTFFLREGCGYYRFSCHAPIKPEDYAEQDKDQALSQMALAYVKVLEQVVKQTPTQWFVFQDVWVS